MILVVKLRNFLILGILFFGCQGKNDEIQEIKGQVFGSTFSVKYRGVFANVDFKPEIQKIFDQVNQNFSTYQEVSLINEVNESVENKEIKITPLFLELFSLSKELNIKTNGAFDPSIYPLVLTWGFGPVKNPRHPKKEEITRALKCKGIDLFEINPKQMTLKKKRACAKLDFNSISPGHTAHMVAKFLESRQIHDYLVDIGGEFVAKGEKAKSQSWRVGIETPSMKVGESLQRIIELKNESIATSGNYRNFFDEKGVRKGHILSPLTGEPVTHNIASASVIASTPYEADAWATAMMVLGTEGLELAEKNGLKVLLLKADSPGEFTEILNPSMKNFLNL